jgi:hypothetical protein
VADGSALSNKSEADASSECTLVVSNDVEPLYAQTTENALIGTSPDRRQKLSPPGLISVTIRLGECRKHIIPPQEKLMTSARNENPILVHFI